MKLLRYRRNKTQGHGVIREKINLRWYCGKPYVSMNMSYTETHLMITLVRKILSCVVTAAQFSLPVCSGNTVRSIIVAFEISPFTQG